MDYEESIRNDVVWDYLWRLKEDTDRLNTGGEKIIFLEQQDKVFMMI